MYHVVIAAQLYSTSTGMGWDVVWSVWHFVAQEWYVSVVLDKTYSVAWIAQIKNLLVQTCSQLKQLKVCLCVCAIYDAMCLHSVCLSPKPDRMYIRTCVCLSMQASQPQHRNQIGIYLQMVSPAVGGGRGGGITVGGCSLKLFTTSGLLSQLVNDIHRLHLVEVNREGR